METFFKVIPMI